MTKVTHFGENNNTTPPQKNADKDKTPAINFFCEDMMAAVKSGNIDEVIGKDTEVDQLVNILSKRKRNNIFIVGESGIGKSALVWCLVQRIIERKVPKILFDKKIMALSLTSLVAGAKFRGEFEERMNDLLRELKEHPEIILFIDEAHQIIGAGNTSGSMDAANLIKPALERGELRCICATTFDEYKKSIENDAALERRFQKITVRIPSDEETFLILKGVKYRFENFHYVSYSDEVLKHIIYAANRFMTDRNQPDKAIDLLDSIGAHVKLKNISVPESIKSLESELERLREQKRQAIANQDYKAAIVPRNEEKIVLEKIDTENKIWQNKLQTQKIMVRIEDINAVVSKQTGILIEKISSSDNVKLSEMEDYLKDRVIGQNHAVDKICDAVLRMRVGIQDETKPIGSFLFLGPTGTGKTFLARQLALYLFNTQESFIRIDCSEFMEPHSIAKLIGSPPGYIGFEEGGDLTEAIKNNPYSVLLIDEVEKAHPQVLNIFLSILDEGHLKDAKGKVVNFKNTIIIWTSNIGTDKITATNKLGFSQSNYSYENDVENLVMNELKKKMRPELINRLDEKIVFKMLTENDIEKIVENELKIVCDRIAKKGYKISIHENVKKFICKDGFDKVMGARPLKRSIKNHIETTIARYITVNNNKISKEIKLIMDKKKGEVIVK